MNMNIKRPKRLQEEDEEDLLEFQRQFLQNKNDQPAAKVIRKQPVGEAEIAQTNPISAETSKPAKLIEKNKSTKIDFDADENAFSLVLGDIVEKKLTPENFKDCVVNNDSFPTIEKINLKQFKSDSTRKTTANKSLFAQNLENKGKLKSFYALSKVHQPSLLKRDQKIQQLEESLVKPEQSTSTSLNAEGKKKQLITGQGLGNANDAEQIHLENLERLAQMKQDEILSERDKLIQQLDPKIVAFIKKRSSNNVVRNEESKAIKKDDTKMNEKDLIDELPIKPDKKWLHMDKIEYDKLEWMMKKPTNVVKKGEEEKDGEKGSPARFDFNGDLIAPDAEIPMTKALHHHGNNPELAGYTLDELFHLSRSKFNQQKVLALQTLANIIKKCHLGEFWDQIKSGANNLNDLLSEECQDEKDNLLNQLIDGGVLFLLRWCLDDQTESVIQVSLAGIANILQPAGQEFALDTLFDLNKGTSFPSLHPFSSIFQQSKQLFALDTNLTVNKAKDLDELSDDEYLKHDLVKGLLRMNFLHRVFYLLDTYRPSSSQIVQSIFEILFRCLRHSPEIAHEFHQKYPGLIQLIVRSFLPQFLNADEFDNVLLIKNATFALKFLRLVSSTGPNTAQKLHQEYQITSRITSYLSTVESDELLDLQTESVRYLKVLNAFGIEIANGCLEILQNNLSHVLKKLSQTKNTSFTIYFQALISFFSQLIQSFENETNNEQCASLVFSIISTFVYHTFDNYFTKSSNKFDLNLISVCLHYITDFLEKSPAKHAKTCQKLIEQIYAPTLTSDNLRLNEMCMSSLVSSSIFGVELDERHKKISSNNLSYLPILLADSETPRQVSSFTFLTAFLRLLNFCHKLNPNLSQLCQQFLKNSNLKSYLTLFVKSQPKKSYFYFQTRHENFFIMSVLRLALTIYEMEEDCEDEKSFEMKRFYFKTGFVLMQKIKRGDEFLLSELLTTLFFSVNLWSAYLATNDSLTKKFDRLKIGDHCLMKMLNNDFIEVSYLNSGNDETLRLSKGYLEKMEQSQIYECLNQIRYAFLDNENLFTLKQLEHSRKLNRLDSNKNVNSLFLSVLNTNSFVLSDSAWFYAPISFYLRQQIKKNEQHKILSTVSNCLKFVYLLEVYYGEFLDSVLEPTLRYVNMLFLYLYDSDVFLDKQIVTYSYLIFLKWSKDKKRPLENLSLELKIEGLMSFYDFYQHLLTHYDATSFGDYVFGLYLTVPLQMNYSARFRQLFWSDYFHLFKYIKFDSDSTKLLIGINRFLQPNETSLHMIRLFSQLLLDQSDFDLIAKSRFAYTVLIAHLNAFLFEHLNCLERQVEFDFKKLILNRIFGLGNEKIKHDLIYFKSVNPISNDMEFFDDLPNIRKQWLNKMKTHSN